jgi:hypothetical protein
MIAEVVRGGLIAYVGGLALGILDQLLSDKCDPGPVLFWPLWVLVRVCRRRWIRPTRHALYAFGHFLFREAVRPFKSSSPR